MTSKNMFLLLTLGVLTYLLFQDDMVENLIATFSFVFSLHILFNLRFTLKILNELSEIKVENFNQDALFMIERYEKEKIAKKLKSMKH